MDTVDGRSAGVDERSPDRRETGGERGETPSGVTASARGEGTPDRFWLLVTGLLLVTMPALTLAVAYVALTATRSVLLEQITVVEAVELYLVELVAFTAFAYLLYRLTMYTSQRQEQVATEHGRPEDPGQD